MGQKNWLPFWIIFGVGLVIVGALAFLLASLGRGTGDTASAFAPAQATPSPSAPTARPLAPTPAESSVPTSPVLPAVSSPPDVPSSAPAIPATAPDFALAQAAGGTFALSEHLARGPVVLVFVNSGGG